MEMLSPIKRRILVEDICKRFHSDGISRLETVGHFEKYTPLYHFRIAEPSKDFSFIFITDLFGDQNIDAGLVAKGLIGSKGFRMQYHGSYEGLDKMILQGIHDGMVVSHHGEILLSPPFRLHSVGSDLTDENRLTFDNALRYLNEISKFDTPETMKTSTYSEIFSSTYYIL